MHSLKFYASVFICLLLLLGCAKEPVKPKLLESMADFDRLYVPTMVFTDLAKQRESEIALERLKEKWDSFNQDYYNLEMKYGVNIVDKFWQEDFDKIEQAMVSAETLVASQELGQAHEELAKIQYVFLELRHRNGFDYFLDEMTTFNDSIQEIIICLRGKSNLSDKEYEQLLLASQKAKKSLSKLAVSKIDPGYFGFSLKKIKAIRKRVSDQEKLMSAFETALSSGDIDLLFQSAQDLKPNYTVFYKAFGDFQPVFDQVIKERKEQEKDKEKEDKEND